MTGPSTAPAGRVCVGCAARWAQSNTGGLCRQCFVKRHGEPPPRPAPPLGPCTHCQRAPGRPGCEGLCRECYVDLAEINELYLAQLSEQSLVGIQRVRPGWRRPVRYVTAHGVDYLVVWDGTMDGPQGRERIKLGGGRC